MPENNTGGKAKKVKPRYNMLQNSWYMVKIAWQAREKKVIVLCLLSAVLVTGVVSYFAANYANSFEYRYKDGTAEYKNHIDYILETEGELGAAKDIRIFGLRGWLEELYAKVMKAYTAFNGKIQNVYLGVAVLDVVLTFMRNGIAYMYLIMLVMDGKIDVAQFLLLFSAVGGFAQWVTGILKEFNNLHRQSIDISMTREFLEYDEPFKFDGGEHLRAEPGKAYEIRLENVSFRYPDADKDTLTDINLTLHPGEKLAVVGLNGAGKTTLIKLICGFLDPTRGRVLLNGRDIRDFNRADYYTMFSAVFQDFSLLPGTIAMNIAQTDDDIDMLRVKKCAAEAGIAGKIESLAESYNTYLNRQVYKDAVMLSGGETQSLMLARALYKEAPLEVPKVKAGELKPAGNLAKKFSVGVRWNLRDIGRNKGRTITGIVGIVGCTMLIVCAFGMRDTIQFFIKWQFEDLYNFEYKLDVESTISDETYKQLTDSYGDDTSMTLAVEAFDISGNTSTRQIVITDAGDKVRYTDHKARKFELSDDGIYVSEKLLSILGLHVGENVSWSVYGEDKTYTTKIAGTFREPQGQKFAMTRAYAESIGIEYKADCLYTDEDLSEVKNIAGVSLITGIAALKDGMMSMINMMDTVILLLMVVSVILAVVIIYNLGILSFSEKQYQFATMKVLGFRSKQIRKIYVMQNIWVCVVAIIIGLPLGEYMTALIYKLAMGDNYDMLVRVAPVTYVVGAVGIFAVAYLVNLWLGRKVKTIDMVTSLKANE